MSTSTEKTIKANKEERARIKELNDAKIEIFKSEFRADDRKLEDDPLLAVEYIVDERGEPIRNVFFKNAKENLEPLRRVEAQGYRFEILTPTEKELAYGLYKDLPLKLRRKLGVVPVKTGAGRGLGRGLGRGRATRKKGKGKGKGKKGKRSKRSNSYSFKVRR